jgi:hypothetical protein
MTRYQEKILRFHLDQIALGLDRYNVSSKHQSQYYPLIHSQFSKRLSLQNSARDSWYPFRTICLASRYLLYFTALKLQSLGIGYLERPLASKVYRCNLVRFFVWLLLRDIRGRSVSVSHYGVDDRGSIPGRSNEFFP